MKDRISWATQPVAVCEKSGRQWRSCRPAADWDHHCSLPEQIRFAGVKAYLSTGNQAGIRRQQAKVQRQLGHFIRLG